MSQRGCGEAESFAYRHPVLYAARAAIICTAIMVVSKSVGASLDEDSVSVGGVVRYVFVVFTVVFLTASGFLVVAKRRGQLKR
jgi:hypothetical protein